MTDFDCCAAPAGTGSARELAGRARVLSAEAGADAASALRRGQDRFARTLLAAARALAATAAVLESAAEEERARLSQARR